MKSHRLIALTLLIIVLIFPFISSHAQSEQPVVRVVLFYSPSCAHCEYVITQALPPLAEKYGERLQVAYIDVTEPAGNELFLAALKHFDVDRGGVPFLVIGDTYLMGSVDIPEKFPGMIESHLAAGGLDWPGIPGVKEAIAGSVAQARTDAIATQGAPVSEPVQVTKQPDALSWSELFAQDPLANTLAVIVLVAMLIAVIWAVLFFRKPGSPSPTDLPAWVIPALCAIGILVAGYLAYVEATGSTAVCGPVGHCNAVQQSPYARLFGLFPIGQIGLIGYAAILVAWLVSRHAKGRNSDLGFLALFLLAYFGAWFSVYLTFLEPFVIGATCAWCLTSALLMTILMVISAAPAKSALARLAANEVEARTS